MLASFPIALIVGTILGFLSGLGTGGGSLLILWLTLVLHTPASQARLINLMFFLPSAAMSCLFRWKQGNWNIKKVLPAILTGSLSAVLFSIFGKSMDNSLLQKLFGGLLLVTGIRELIYRPKQ